MLIIFSFSSDVYVLKEEIYEINMKKNFKFVSCKENQRRFITTVNTKHAKEF